MRRENSRITELQQGNGSFPKIVSETILNDLSNIARIARGVEHTETQKGMPAAPYPDY
jgi:hypothetical protein